VENKGIAGGEAYGGGEDITGDIAEGARKTS